jgi:hypothetical protein
MSTRESIKRVSKKVHKEETMVDGGTMLLLVCLD